MKEMIPLSLRQRKAFVWWARREYEDYAAIICDGAIRSGKTLAMGMGFFFWAMACFSDRQFALCGRSVGALRRNLLETVLPQLRRLGFACEEKRSEKLLIVRRRGRENRFYLFGGANEASAALIQGMTLAGVLFDEAALMPRSFVEQAVEGSRLWFSCNPEGPNHWFYREWVCRAEEKRALYLHFTMADNPSLSARVRARYESIEKSAEDARELTVTLAGSVDAEPMDRVELSLARLGVRGTFRVSETLYTLSASGETTELTLWEV